MKTKLNWTQAEEEGEEEKELVVWLVECVDPSALNEPEALADIAQMVACLLTSSTCWCDSQLRRSETTTEIILHGFL